MNNYEDLYQCKSLLTRAYFHPTFSSRLLVFMNQIISSKLQLNRYQYNDQYKYIEIDFKNKIDDINQSREVEEILINSFSQFLLLCINDHQLSSILKACDERSYELFVNNMNMVINSGNIRGAYSLYEFTAFMVSCLMLGNCTYRLILI